MRRLITQWRRLGRRRFTRSWRRSGGLWGGGWSLCCRGHGLCRRLPPFRKVRGRMGHPMPRVLNSQSLVLRDPTRPLLFFLPLLLVLTVDGRGRPSLHFLPLLLVLTVDGRGRPSLHRERFWMSCRRWLRDRLRGALRVGSKAFGWRLIRSLRMRTRRGRRLTVS